MAETKQSPGAGSESCFSQSLGPMSHDTGDTVPLWWQLPELQAHSRGEAQECTINALRRCLGILEVWPCDSQED